VDSQIVDLQYLIHYLDIELVIVFGSYLYGDNYNGKSDIDILVVSNDFIHILEFKRKTLVKRCLTSTKVDPICLTEFEYSLVLAKKTAFTKEIVETWKVMYDKYNSSSIS
jgi:predicted nucleotidyltransferase